MTAQHTKEKIQNLFSEYEKAFSALDFRRIADWYSDSFISAGPKGTITQNKKEFLESAEKATEFYEKVGQTSARILSIEEEPISDHYTMVKVLWGAFFKKTGDEPVEFDVSYLVQHTGAELEIILFIAHQDENEAMKKLELI